MKKSTGVAGIVALCFALSGATLAPAALAASTQAPSTDVASISLADCESIKRDTRAYLAGIGRPTGSNDGEFLYAQVKKAFNDGLARDRARDLLRRLEFYCGG